MDGLSQSCFSFEMSGNKMTWPGPGIVREYQQVFYDEIYLVKEQPGKPGADIALTGESVSPHFTGKCNSKIPKLDWFLANGPSMIAL